MIRLLDVAGNGRVLAESDRELRLPREQKRPLDELWCSPERRARGRQELTGVETSRVSPNGGHRTGTARAINVAAPEPEPFAVEIHRRDDVAIVQPSGELDLATVETLHAALDAIDSAARPIPTDPHRARRSGRQSDPAVRTRPGAAICSANRRARQRARRLSEPPSRRQLTERSVLGGAFAAPVRVTKCRRSAACAFGGA